MSVLLNGQSPSGIKSRPDVVSGVSAGSMSAVAINAILKTMDGKALTPFTLDDYTSYLFNMTEETVIDISLSGFTKILTRNVPRGFILDNTPLETNLAIQLNKMGFRVMSDLYIPTCISVVESNTGLTVRICSDDPAVADVPVLDVIMASAAMPVVFSMRKIRNFNDGITNSSGLYIDGGSGTDMVPLFSLLNRYKLDEAFMITRQSEIGTRNGLPQWILGIPILANTLAMISDFFQSLFLASIDAAHSARVPTYQYTPILPVVFSTLDFDHARDQWLATMLWATENDPILLNPDRLHKLKGQSD